VEVDIYLVRLLCPETYAPTNCQIYCSFIKETANFIFYHVVWYLKNSSSW